MGEKITSFTKLDAWKQGHALVLSVYAVTKTFPPSKLYGLVSQMQRAAISITSNISEGFSRQSYKEKIQFYSVSLGSVSELQNQLLIAKDVGYIQTQLFIEIAKQSVIVHKLINGLIKKSKSILHDS